MIIDPSVIRQVSREKDIDPEKMFAALEEAMSSAARKFYRDKAVVTAIDRKSGEMSVTSRRTVVEDRLAPAPAVAAVGSAASIRASMTPRPRCDDRT